MYTVKVICTCCHDTQYKLQTTEMVVDLEMKQEGDKKKSIFFYISPNVTHTVSPFSMFAFQQIGRLPTTCRSTPPPATCRPKPRPRGCWLPRRSPKRLPRPLRPRRRMTCGWSWRTPPCGSSSARWARRWSSQRRAGERKQWGDLWSPQPP